MLVSYDSGLANQPITATKPPPLRTYCYLAPQCKLRSILPNLFLKGLSFKEKVNILNPRVKYFSQAAQILFRVVPEDMATLGKLRIPLIVGVSILGLTSVLYFTSSRILLSSFTKVERQTTQRNVKRVLEALSNKLDGLQTEARDYAYWDDTYAFMETRDGEYVNSNWVEAAFESLQLNLVALVQPAGQIPFGQAFDLENGQYIPLSEELLTHLKPNDLLLPGLGPKPQSGILLLTEGAMLIASSPILTTEQTGPSRGRLVMGRYLDGAEIAEFVNLTRVSVRTYLVNDAQLPKNLKQVRYSLLKAPKEIVVQPLGDNCIAGYAMLLDIYNNPALILQIVAPRDFYQQGLLSLRYLKLSLLIVGFLAGLAIWFLLSKLVQSLTERERMEQALTQQEALRRSEQRYRDKAEELEKALGQLQMAQTRLVQNEKMSSLGQMVAGIAHELNNPVSFIDGNLPHIEAYSQGLLELVYLYQKYYPDPIDEIREHSQLIDLDFLSEDLGKILKSMWVGAKRISQIVLSLRNFSRLNQVSMKPVDIHEGIDNTLIILQHRLKTQPNRPEIQVVKLYGDLPLVECYAGELNQVFMNLLANAIDALDEELKNADWGLRAENFHKMKYSRGAIEAANTGSAPYPKMPIPYPAPTIKIQTESLEPHSVIIRISDNGPGIPEHMQQKLFDPFFTTKPIGKGTGLGLSISYQIVEKHLGRLQCVSKLGEGAMFVIQLPVKQQYSVSQTILTSG